MIKKGMMTNIRSKMGALMVKPALKETLKSFDASEYGGAPLLGLKGLVVKSHGSARSVEIRHAIFQCEQFKEEKINEKIEEFIAAEQKAQAEEKSEKKIKPGLPEILQTEQEANSRGTGNAEDHHRKNSGKKYGCHYRKNYLCG